MSADPVWHQGTAKDRPRMEMGRGRNCALGVCSEGATWGMRMRGAAAGAGYVQLSPLTSTSGHRAQCGGAVTGMLRHPLFVHMVSVWHACYAKLSVALYICAVVMRRASHAPFLTSVLHGVQDNGEKSLPVSCGCFALCPSFLSQLNKICSRSSVDRSRQLSRQGISPTWQIGAWVKDILRYGCCWGGNEAQCMMRMLSFGARACGTATHTQGEKNG